MGWRRRAMLLAAIAVVGVAGTAGVASAGVTSAGVTSAGVTSAGVTEMCRFDGKVLAEISGLAVSPTHEGIVWAHNDSGGGPRLYAIDTTSCDIVATVRVRGAQALDPEALAAGTGPLGAPVLWWGDIGDNTAQRRSVSILEVPEPTVLRDVRVSSTTYRVTLDKPADAEALLADRDRLWMIGKGLTEGTIWQLPHPLRSDRAARATGVGTEEALVTDAAMRPGGGYAVRDYTEVRIYAGDPPGDLIERMPLPDQVQGEAMTWTSDGSALIIASEGDDRLLLVPVDSAPAPAASESTPPTPAAPASPSPTRIAAPTTEPQSSGRASPEVSSAAAVLEPVDRVGSLAVIALIIGAAVFAGSVVAVVVVARMRRVD